MQMSDAKQTLDEGELVFLQLSDPTVLFTEI